MRKIIFLSAIFLLFSNKAFAKDLPTKDVFFFQPLLSLEYSAPALSNGANKNFESNNLDKQIANFENIAIGGNFRVHKFLGVNANWFRGNLSSNNLASLGYLNYKARYKFDQFNLSALAYYPATDFIEFFIESGISNINSKLRYVKNNGEFVNDNSSQVKALYGFGFQLKLGQKSEDLIRFSFQKYSGKLSAIDANYATARIGYLKAF